jgi:hypothetical protein
MHKALSSITNTERKKSSYLDNPTELNRKLLGKKAVIW